MSVSAFFSAHVYTIQYKIFVVSNSVIVVLYHFKDSLLPIVLCYLRNVLSSCWKDYVEFYENISTNMVENTILNHFSYQNTMDQNRDKLDIELCASITLNNLTYSTYV